jgi:maltooligosyltrehalose trehalohydrolase
MRQWRSLRRPNLVLDDPADPATFEACKLDHSESARHAATYALHRDLLALRRLPVFSQQQFARRMDGAVLGPEAFVVRFFSEDFSDDKLLLMNLGRDLHLDPAPEPLLAPPEHKRWAILWSSEDPRYGGFGTHEPDSGGSWNIPGHAAVVLEAR